MVNEGVDSVLIVHGGQRGFLLSAERMNGQGPGFLYHRNEIGNNS